MTTKINLTNIMKDLNNKWEKEKKYNEWLNQQVENNKIKMLVYQRGKMFSYYPELSKLFYGWKDTTDKKIRISVGSMGINDLREMTAILRKKVLKNIVRQMVKIVQL